MSDFDPRIDRLQDISLRLRAGGQVAERLRSSAAETRQNLERLGLRL